MGTLFSALFIARSGLQVAQVQLDTAGHNIANVNKEGFSRQRVELLSRVPNERAFGKLGRGVGVGTIIRIRDIFLDTLFRNTNPDLGSAEIRAEFLRRIEDVFLEPSDGGLSAKIGLFFDSLNEFATNVESLPVRQSVINESEALAGSFNDVARLLFELRTAANQEVIGFVPDINDLAQRIAALNDQIRRGEADGKPSNDLRDDRDLLLDELSKITTIFTRERPNGMVDVLVAGDALVNGNRSRDVQAVSVPALDPERNDLVEIQFVDNGQIMGIQGGALAGALDVRDNVIVNIDGRLDSIAATLIQQINLIHSQGRGLSGFSGTVSTTNATVDAVTPLDVAGLPFPVQSGSFDVTVYDSTGTVTATATIAVTAGVTTLTDLTAALNTVSPDLSAALTGTNTIDVTANAGFTFSISNDTSGVFTALGMNGLFTGFDARTMGVNQDIVNDARLLASGFDSDILATGDNTAALAMADVQNGLFLDGNTSTIMGFYETTIVELGVDARSTLSNLDVQRTFVDGFQRRRQEISGVSLDEEVTFLLQFQRAFEASARVVTVTDRMLDSLLTMAL